jgi:hypothetical protein
VNDIFIGHNFDAPDALWANCIYPLMPGTERLEFQITLSYTKLNNQTGSHEMETYSSKDRAMH